MRRIASYVALLLLLTAVVPAFACITGAPVTPEERVCCTAMHSQCGGGEMAKMPCCRTHVSSTQLPEQAAIPFVSQLHWVVVAHLSRRGAEGTAVAIRLDRTPEEYPPPGLVTARTTVLRV